jgi:hypothetical protein
MEELLYHKKIREIAAGIALTHGNAAVVAPIMGETIDTRLRYCRIRLGLVVKRRPSAGLLASARKPRNIDVRGSREPWIYAGVVDTVEVVFESVCVLSEYEKTRNIFKTENLLQDAPEKEAQN